MPKWPTESQNETAMHVQETAHTIKWHKEKIHGREDNWGRRVLEVLFCDSTQKTKDGHTWMHFGSIVALCSPRNRQLFDWKCYLRRSNLYLRRTSFHSIYVDPQGRRNIQENHLRQTAIVIAPESERTTPRSHESPPPVTAYFLSLYFTLSVSLSWQ